MTQDHGKVECPICEGKGNIRMTFDKDDNRTCIKCKGKGHIDWVEGIRGTTSEDVNKQLGYNFIVRLVEPLIDQIKEEEE